jgi:hypothetical protein
MPAKGVPIAERSRGRPFEKGKSGNPSGSSKERIAANKALAELLKPHEPKAIETLIDLMQNSHVDSVRLRAAEIVLDRIHGKATQRIAGDGDGEPVQIFLKNFVYPKDSDDPMAEAVMSDEPPVRIA